MLGHSLVKIIADGTLVPVVLIGIYVLVFKISASHRYEAYARILMAGLTAYLIAKLMATLYQPVGERPFELLGVTPGAFYLNNPGFPSDHAVFAGAITLAVWFETKNKPYTLVLAFLTLLMCVGRVLALVHTPIDILGGLFAATVGAGWYLTAASSKRSVKKA